MSDIQVLADHQVAIDRVLCDDALTDRAANPVFAAAAPGRLDVMGGIADDGGALVLQAATDQVATAACQARDDLRVMVRRLSDDGVDEHAWPLSALYAGTDALVSAEALAQSLDQADAGWAKTVSGVVYGLVEAGYVPHLGGGVTIVYSSDIPTGAGLAIASATAVATVQALSGLYGLTMTAPAKAAVATHASRAIGGAADDAAAAMTSLVAQGGSLVQVRCQPQQLIGPLTLPTGIKVIGIDSGIRRDVDVRHTQTRIAAYIGRRLIDQGSPSGPGQLDPTRGYLANVSPEEFVQRHRDVLPPKLVGRDAIGRMGVNGDPRLPISPDCVYKVRSRTEHYIYDNRRAQQFAASVARAARTGQDGPLTEAGQFMYASHWSYSQRCGLATIETDVLVNLIRQHGDKAGLFGARLSDIGAGGTVTVLMRDDAKAAEALTMVLQAYRAKTGAEPTVIEPGQAGADAIGWQRYD